MARVSWTLHTRPSGAMQFRQYPTVDVALLTISISMKPAGPGAAVPGHGLITHDDSYVLVVDLRNAGALLSVLRAEPCDMGRQRRASSRQDG